MNNFMKAIFGWAGTLLYWGLIYYALVVEAVWASNILIFFVNVFAVGIFLCLFVKTKAKENASKFKFGLKIFILFAIMAIFASQGWFWCATVYLFGIVVETSKFTPVKTNKTNKAIIDI